MSSCRCVVNLVQELPLDVSTAGQVENAVRRIQKAISHLQSHLRCLAEPQLILVVLRRSRLSEQRGSDDGRLPADRKNKN
jgi:hypothetical protein